MQAQAQITTHALLDSDSPVESVRKPFVYAYPEALPGSSFGIDGILQDPPTPPTMGVPTERLLDTLDAWERQIQSEQCIDVLAPYYRTPTGDALGFRLRQSDGAFLRRRVNGAIAIHPHAWGQLCSLLMTGHPTPCRGGVARAFAWLSPPARAVAFADLSSRSVRSEGAKSPVLLRSHVDPRTGLRALRAVVSGRHSGVHFDDLALIAVLRRGAHLGIPGDATAHVYRGVERTYGDVVLDPSQDCSPVLSWINSEVGASSLAFSAAAVIRAVGLIRFAGATQTDTREVEVELRVASEHGASRRSHTLPRVGRSEDERAHIAHDRIAESIVTATTAARELAGRWEYALKSFPTDLPVRPSDPHVAAAVLGDYLAESGRIAEEHLAGIQSILGDERIQSIPWGSSAYMASAFALLATQQESLESTRALQVLAGEWVRSGW